MRERAEVTVGVEAGSLADTVEDRVNNAERGDFGETGVDDAAEDLGGLSGGISLQSERQQNKRTLSEVSRSVQPVDES